MAKQNEETKNSSEQNNGENTTPETNLENTATEAVEETSSEILESEEQVKEEIVETASETKEIATKKVEETTSEIEEKVEDVKEAIEEKAEETSSELVEKVEEVKEEIEEKAEETTSELEEKVEEAKEEIEEKVEEVKEEIEEKTEETTSEAAEKVEEAKEEIEEKAEETTSETAEKVEEVKEAIEEKAEETISEAAEKVEEVKEEITSEIEENVEEEKPEEPQNFSDMSIVELSMMYEKLSKEADLNKERAKIQTIKSVLQDKFKAEQKAQFQAFIQEGNEAESFEIPPSAHYNRYRESTVRIVERRTKMRELQEAQQLKNLETKKEILAKVKDLVENKTVNEAQDEFRALQDKWRQTGGTPGEEGKELWDNYRFFVEKFYNNLKISRELRELDQEKNLEKKVALCERLEELIIKETSNEVVNEVKKIHDEWKTIGHVPREKSDEIWQRFRLASDKIFEKRRAHFDLMDQGREENLKSKKLLCEEAEALLESKAENHNDWKDLTDKYIELQAKWKAIGPVPKEISEEMWQRFNGASNVFFERKSEFYKAYREEQQQNLELKTELCIQAEAIMDSNSWKSTTEQLIKLQKEWKSIGPVPRNMSNKLWNRFRSACDVFFTKKKKFFNTMEERQTGNLERKLDLIQRIESYKLSDEYEIDIEALKAFQSEWMDIGFVPIKEKDKVTTSYRNAINKHFDDLKLSKFERRQLQLESQGPRPGEDQEQAAKRKEFAVNNQITKLKEDISLWENNIEFFANSKNAEALKEEVQKKIDKAKKELEKLQK